MSATNTPSDALSEKDHVPADDATKTSEKDVETAPATPETPGVQRPGKWRWIMACFGLFMSATLYGLDTTIAADVQGPIYESLGEIEKLPWVGIGFPMGSVAVILLVGKVFSQFEIKWLAIGFLLLFEIGSAICGAAPNNNALIVGRVIAGVGGAGIYIGALTYMSIFTSLKARPLYNASLGLSWGIGAILGPVIGGAFSVNEGATWRWAFYINLPLAALQAPCFIWALPRFQPNPEPTWTKIKQIDWVGVFLNAASFVLLTIALTFSGSTWGWKSPGAIVVWVVFGLAIGSYGVQQVFCVFTDKKNRLFPVHFLQSRSFILLYLATCCVASAAATTIYYIPLLFQFTKGDDAIKAAVRLLPYIIPFVTSTMFSGGLLPVLNRYAPWYLAAGIFNLAGGAGMYTIDTQTSVAVVYGYEVLLAVGTGISFQLAYSAVAAKCDPADTGNAIGYINVSQIGSIAIALGIAGNIFQNIGLKNLQRALDQYNFDDGLLQSALAGTQSQLLRGSAPEVSSKAVSAVVDTLASVFGVTIAGGALTIVCALLMRWEKLNLTPAAG